MTKHALTALFIGFGLSVGLACGDAVKSIIDPDAAAQSDAGVVEPRVFEVECERSYSRYSAPGVGFALREHWYASIDLDGIPENGISASICGRVHLRDPEPLPPCHDGWEECEGDLEAWGEKDLLDCVTTEVTFNSTQARVLCGRSVSSLEGPAPNGDRSRFSTAIFYVR